MLLIISDQPMRFVRSPGKLRPIAEVIEHPVLFQALPALLEVRVQRGATASYSPDSNVITLVDRNRRAAIHELQHAVAELVGLPGGSAPRFFTLSHGEGAFGEYLRQPGEVMAREAASYV